MLVILDAKRRLTVPQALVPARPGDFFEATFDPDEDLLIFRRIAAEKDWLTVLKECPVPMDEMAPRRKEFPRRRKF
jgi:hypothetical protein